MQDSKAYAKSIDRLREFLIRSVGLAVLEFPEKLNPKSEFAKMGPTTWENHKLKGLAETLDVVLEEFTAIQLSLGLSRYDAHRVSRDGQSEPKPARKTTTKQPRKAKP